MSDRQSSADPAFLKNSMAAFAQIAAVVVLFSWCFQIVAPFINVMVWALIIAVAIYPLHLKITVWLGGRAKWSATLIVLVGLAMLIVPTVALTDSTVGYLKTVGDELSGGSIKIPPPTETVKSWPVIGDRVFAAWTTASSDLEGTLNKFGPQLVAVGKKMLGLISHGAMTVLLFVFALLIAGAFLVTAERGYETSCRVGSALAANRGKELTDLAVATIRSVAKGVLGVAIIQAIMAQIVLMIWSVPGAPIWSGVVLMLAIMQLPPIIILAPVAVWVFSTADPLSATVFLVLVLVVSFADAFLKPLFLGRGMEIPMLVILLGAIGGAVSFGIIGLFVGSVVLAMGYTIVNSWIRGEPTKAV
jgi:predicted PurR-regulated permease PerM